MTVTRPASSRRAVHAATDLSPAQKSAVASEAHVTVVQGGPGSGKTEAAVARVARLIGALRQDPAWLLVLVPTEARAQDFRARLTRALAANRCPEVVLRRAAACVVALPALRAGLGTSGAPGQAVDETASAGRIAAVAAELAPALGLARHEDEARALLLEMARRLAGERPGPALGEGDWLRRGMGFVEESVRFAQGEALRRLRILSGVPEGLTELVRELRRPADVAARARELRSALDRAYRSGAGSRVELERARRYVDVAAIDLAEATRREGLAASARTRLRDAARRLLAESGANRAADDSATADQRGVGADASLFGTARHVVVDDAHDLSAEDLGLLRLASAKGSLFVTGDQRSAAWRDGAHTRFRTLLRDAGRAVVLLEAPRFGAGVGRFANALGARLWPATEPGGYAPTISRLDCDPSAAESAEIWLIHRGDTTSGYTRHPEPIADVRWREARVVVEEVRRLALEGGRGGEGAVAVVGAAVVVQHEAAREIVLAALGEAGVPREQVPVLTLPEALGLEWPTVFVTGLDEPLGGPAPRRGWLDQETGLPVVWPLDDAGRGVWPFSSLLLARRAALARDAAARQRLFQAVARARTRVVMSGATRERAAGGESCVAPIEWLRRELGLTDLARASTHHRLGEAAVRVRIFAAQA